MTAGSRTPSSIGPSECSVPLLGTKTFQCPHSRLLLSGTEYGQDPYLNELLNIMFIFNRAKLLQQNLAGLQPSLCSCLTRVCMPACYLLLNPGRLLSRAMGSAPQSLPIWGYSVDIGMMGSSRTHSLALGIDLTGNIPRSARGHSGRYIDVWLFSQPDSRC